MTQKRQLSLADRDSWLEPYRDVIDRRSHYYDRIRNEIDEAGGLLGPISQGHRIFGLHRGDRDGVDGFWYREWAPSADRLSLVGDFNDWDRETNIAQRDELGVWSLFLPFSEVGSRLVHESRYKVHVVSRNGGMDRIPAYANRVLQEPDQSFAARLWMPERGHTFLNKRPGIPDNEGLRIYEAHVGMAQEEWKIGSYDEFRTNVLPRIAANGYNAIQLMGIQEHPYYASFGYHVSSFFAPSSRFGTPDQLRTLIDAAHGLGIVVLLDLVHSHAVKNTAEGLNLFDGTQYQYFHDGDRGMHSAWDSMLFNYSTPEVRRFLLSNIRYWLDEFQFDGFRFDGVTSMLYLDHGMGGGFNSLADYFSPNVDDEALTYLKLATETARAAYQPAITIAEDVSGMPGLCRPVAEGGLGFDYRLSMGVPDFWIKILKERRDEDWNLGDVYHVMLNRRRDEKHIGYAESHDQALVGDKTLAFWLMDAEMYTHMSKDRSSAVVERGIALHEIIRLLTFSLSGEGYLNFMGNEFGHPEWIDFPRAGNNNSYQYARRQWSLADNPHLKYEMLREFDRCMLALDPAFGLLTDSLIEQLAVHEDSRQLIYRRGPLVFAVNLHPTESYFGLRMPVPDAEDYRYVLSTDEHRFGGFGRCDQNQVFPCQAVPMYGRDQTIEIYLPSRTALVLAPVRLTERIDAYRTAISSRNTHD
ncbi:MAG: alpha amylase C-terminal domain-containing protein [Fimbriimonas sp.]|nr:alpha amylase C-terminal domain-containing protein [Fimbriimonas sp.]